MSASSGATRPGGRQFKSGKGSSREEESPYSNSEGELEQSVGTLVSTTPPTASSVRRGHLEEVLHSFDSIEAEVEELKERVKELDEEKSRTHHSHTVELLKRDDLLRESVLDCGKLRAGQISLYRELLKERAKARETQRLQLGRFSELEIELEKSRNAVEPSISNEALQVQNVGLEECNKILQRQLDALKRENVALSRKVGSSDKGSKGSTNLQKQHLEELQQEKLQLVQMSREREARAEAHFAEQVKDLKLENVMLTIQLRRQERRLQEMPESRMPLGQSNNASSEDLNEARADMEHLEETITELQSFLKSQDQEIQKYAHAVEQAIHYSDVSELFLLEDTAHPRDESEGLEPQSTQADDPRQGDDAASSPTEIDEPVLDTSQLGADQKLCLRNMELEDENRGLKALHINWYKLFQKFQQRRSDALRKDASNHQIKKTVKTLRKIVKEAKLNGT